MPRAFLVWDNVDVMSERRPLYLPHTILHVHSGIWNLQESACALNMIMLVLPSENCVLIPQANWSNTGYDESLYIQLRGCISSCSVVHKTSRLTPFGVWYIIFFPNRCSLLYKWYFLNQCWFFLQLRCFYFTQLLTHWIIKIEKTERIGEVKRAWTYWPYYIWVGLINTNLSMNQTWDQLTTE